MKKSLSFWSILPPLLIILGVLLLIFRVWANRRNQTTTGPIVDADPEPDEPEPDEPPASKEQRIVSHFKLIRSVLPATYSDAVAQMITAHAMHETGIFTSRLYKEQNNLFGMRHPTIRETVSTGENHGFATYNTLEDSIRDLLLYFKEFGIGSKFAKVDDYVKAIKAKGYFTDNYVTYFNAVRSHFNKVKELIQ